VLDKRGRRSAKFARRVRFAVSRFTDVVVNTSWGLRISSYPRVSPGIPPYPAISRHIPPYPAADTAKTDDQNPISSQSLTDLMNLLNSQM